MHAQEFLLAMHAQEFLHGHNTMWQLSYLTGSKGLSFCNHKLWYAMALAEFRLKWSDPIRMDSCAYSIAQSWH